MPLYDPYVTPIFYASFIYQDSSVKAVILLCCADTGFSYFFPMGHGRCNGDKTPWVMGPYNVVQRPTLPMGHGVVQRLTPSMGHGVVQHCTTTHPLHGSWGCTMLYNSAPPPWVMRLYNIVQLSVDPMGHETYDYPRKIYN